MPENTPKAELRIDWATHEATRHACERWHYSKSVPVPPLVKIGAWEDGKFIGVVIFSRGASTNLLKPYGLKQDEGCELTRVALSAHRSPVTRIIRLAIAFLRRNSPGLRLIVSFADPGHGHHGGIYQGGNWIYAGESASVKEFYHCGKRLHPRQISSSGFNVQMGVRRKVLKPSECLVKVQPGKHRYLMPLDDEMRKQILPMSKPYPKRAKKQDGENPSSLGGAIPTRALQLPDD